MAALSVENRTRIWRGLMRYWSTLPVGDADKSAAFSKFELYDANANTGLIADLDNWLDTHAGTTAPDTVGANGAINSSYRTKFTTGQKGLTVAVIALLRTGNVEFLRRIVGEVD